MSKNVSVPSHEEVKNWRPSATSAGEVAAEYEKLHLENDDLRFEVTRLRASVESQQQQIFELSRRLGERFDTWDDGVHSREIDRLRAEIDPLRAEIEHMRAKIDYLRAKEHLLNEILGSRSWRLTRSYRFLGTRVQRLLGSVLRR